MNGGAYRDVDDLDRAKATIAALEKENAQMQWKLIQMGQFCQHLGGRPKDAYKTRRSLGQVVYMSLTVFLIIAATALLLRLAVEMTNAMGCA